MMILVKQRIWFKIMLLTIKCLIGKAPVYLRDMVERYMPNRALRSSNALLLKVPRFRNKTLGARTLPTLQIASGTVFRWKFVLLTILTVLSRL